MVAVEEVETTMEGETSLHAGGADFEVVVLRDQILEADPLLPCLNADLEEGEGEGEGVGLVEEEDLEGRIWEASRRVTSVVEGPGTIRWTKLTLWSNSGVSQRDLSSFLRIHGNRVS